MATDPTTPPKDMADMDLAAFCNELVSGRLRWTFSILAVVSVTTFVWTFVDPTIEAWFPFHAAGRTLQWLVGASAVLWILLASFNWRNWHRWKRSQSVNLPEPREPS